MTDAELAALIAETKAAERERCARIAETCPGCPAPYAAVIAEAIRADKGTSSCRD